MRCQKCGRDAVIFQRYSGLHLCRDHFTADFEARAKKAIRTHRWIEPRDTIAVAMSGGKDSSALLHFLVNTFGKRRDLTILAVTIDEGIRGYRDPDVARKIAESMDVPWHTASFREAFGITIDEIVGMKGDSLSCSYCGVLRRQLLNRTARELGATKVALGFNLDDEAQSVLMNVLRGDAARLTRMQAPAPGMVPRIRPFIALPEREVALYAHLHVEGFEEAGCPYAHNAIRADVRGILNDYAYRHPATKFALVNLGDELARLGPPAEGPRLEPCPRCGEPCQPPCRVCGILGEVGRG
jgi:uncharacterized protein (TIGR00269 family)